MRPAAAARRSATRPAAPAASCSPRTTTSPSTTKLDKDQKKHLKLEALRGVELVDSVARLCAMNLFLHGIGPATTTRVPVDQPTTPSRAEPGERFDVVLTNPPFGKKSSITVVNEEGEQTKETP